MDEQAKAALAELMQRLLDGVDSAVEFGEREIPVVLEQLLTWHFTESLIWFAIGLLLLITAAVTLYVMRGKPGARKIRQAEAWEAYERGESWTRHSGISNITSVEYDAIMQGGDIPDKFPEYMTAAVLSTVGAPILTTNLTWLKIWIAPKLYLLEYGASLVK